MTIPSDSGVGIRTELFTIGNRLIREESTWRKPEEIGARFNLYWNRDVLTLQGDEPVLHRLGMVAILLLNNSAPDGIHLSALYMSAGINTGAVAQIEVAAPLKGDEPLAASPLDDYVFEGFQAYRQAAETGAVTREPHSNDAKLLAEHVIAELAHERELAAGPVHRRFDRL